jgi:DNA-binding transcriptional ArsR family regulator
VAPSGSRKRPERVSLSLLPAQALRDGAVRERLVAKAGLRARPSDTAARRDAMLVGFVAATLLLDARAFLPGGALDGSLSASRLATLAGLGHAAVESALRLLDKADVCTVHWGDQDVRIAFQPDVLGPAPDGGILDWPRIVERLAGRAAALLSTRALVSIPNGVRAPFTEFTSVAAADLMDATGYTRESVYRALAAAEDAGVLESEAPQGRPKRFRFTPLSLGLSEPPEDGQREVTPVGEASEAATEVPAEAAAPPLPRSVEYSPQAAPSAARGEGLWLTMRGVTIYVPAGSSLSMPPGSSIDILPDGTLSIRPASS